MRAPRAALCGKYMGCPPPCNHLRLRGDPTQLLSNATLLTALVSCPELSAGTKAALLERGESEEQLRGDTCSPLGRILLLAFHCVSAPFTVTSMHGVSILPVEWPLVTSFHPFILSAPVKVASFR